MHDAKTIRQRTTAIYILISFLVFFIGTAMAIWGGGSVTSPDDIKNLATPIQNSPTAFSVGTSLLAAGLVSLGFALIRKYDDHDSAKLHESIDSHEERLRSFNQTLQRVRSVIPDAAQRCFFDSELSDSFVSAINTCAPRKEISVDVVGLKLHRFLRDQFELLKKESKNRPINVRMLLQDPEHNAFEALCQLESRDLEGTKNDIVSSLLYLEGATYNAEKLIYTDENLKIEVKFYEKFQPIAFFRVNKTVMVRPRIRSTGIGTRFYETYTEDEGHSYFGLFHDHFDTCWKSSSFEIPSTLSIKLLNKFKKY